LRRFELVDITRIMEKDVMQKESTTRPKLSLSFELSRSHLIELLSAKISADETVMEEIVPPKLEKKETEKKEEEDGDAEEKESGEEGASSEDAEEKPETTESTESEDGAEAEAGDGDSESTEEPEVEKEYKEVIVPHSFNVDKIDEFSIGARLLNKD
jgi:cytoskeletal protein RodZ